MNEARLHAWLLGAMALLALVVFVSLLVRPAPYGRHGAGKAWGPTLSSRLAWVLMESPSVVTFGAAYLCAPRPIDAVLAAFFVMWQAHYVHRAFLFPWRLRRATPMPLFVCALGAVFTGLNGWLNGRGITALHAPYGDAWLRDPRFVLGVALFVAGSFINRHADRVLLRLRRPGETDYKIPRGGLFRWLSCPNYLGEIVEWCGWAVATWSLPGAVFVVWTAANLVPRALAHHRWYRAQFADYPADRKALVPFVG